MSLYLSATIYDTTQNFFTILTAWTKIWEKGNTGCQSKSSKSDMHCVDVQGNKKRNKTKQDQTRPNKTKQDQTRPNKTTQTRPNLCLIEKAIQVQ